MQSRLGRRFIGQVIGVGLLGVVAVTGFVPVSVSASSVPTLAHAASTQAGQPELIVDSATADRGSVVASGLATVPVTLTIRARYSSPDESTRDPRMPLTVLMQRTAGRAPAGGHDLKVVPLALTSGTVADGTWRGLARMGSVDNGTFTVTGVWPGIPCFTCGVEQTPLPLEGPSIRTRGVHVPRLSIEPVPPRVALSSRAASLRGRVLDSATGRPYSSRIPVYLAYDSTCAESDGGTIVRTDRSGRYRYAVGARLLVGVHCARLYAVERDSLGGLVRVLGTATAFEVYTSVTMKPASRSVLADHPLAVRGTVAGARTDDGLVADVQYLRGRSQWRSLGSAPVTGSATGAAGTYYVRIRPSTKGRLTLRATLVGGVAGTSSRAVVTVR